MFCLLQRSLLGAVLLTACMFGCGQKPQKEVLPPLYPAKGKVLVGGQPMADMVVVLMPSNPQENSIRGLVGRTEADGTFTMVSAGFRAHDGGPAGEYIALVGMAEENTKHTDNDRRSYNERYSKYLSPKTSPLHVTIKEVPAGETNDLGTLNV